MTTTTRTTGYGWRLAALSLAMLLPSLGISVANVALPTIATSFGAAFSDVQWVVVCYLLAVTTLIVGAGRLGDLAGRRRVLLAGIALFTVASLACAFSPSLWILIAARALQGAGAAFMMSLTIASVADTLPKEQTGRAMGLLGTVSAVGTALGPTLGGALVASSGWPSVFAVIAAIGVVSFVLGWRLFDRGAPVEASDASFDVPGFLLLAVALGAYSLSVSSSAMPVFGIAVAIVALALFVVVELRSAAPLLSIEQLHDRALSSSLVALALVTTIVMAALVVGPFYLTGAAGLNIAQTGLVMSVGPTVSALVGVPSGRMVDGWGARPAALTGLASSAIGCVLMVMLPAFVGVPGYIAALVPITAGYALFQAANNTAVMKSAAADRRGLVSALLGLSRNLGLITGASAMGTVFAIASGGVPAFNLPSGDLTGLEITFALGGALALIALLLVSTARPSSVSRMEHNHE